MLTHGQIIGVGRSRNALHNYDPGKKYPSENPRLKPNYLLFSSVYSHSVARLKIMTCFALALFVAVLPIFFMDGPSQIFTNSSSFAVINVVLSIV